VLNYLVFGFAAIAEATSWIRAYRQTRAEANAQNRSLSQHIRLSPDPTVKTVASEDTVAVIGDVLGLAATGVQQLTGQPLWDGVAALLIMVMLIFVAFALARDNKDLLIGEAIEPEKEQRIHQLLNEEPRIDEVLDVRSMRIGTDDVLIVARVDLGDNLDSATIHQLTEHVDHKLRTELPEVSLVFIDPRRRPTTTAHQTTTSRHSTHLPDLHNPNLIRPATPCRAHPYSGVRHHGAVSSPTKSAPHERDCPRIGQTPLGCATAGGGGLGRYPSLVEPRAAAGEAGRRSPRPHQR
jgi:hypothetical protein